MKYSLFFIDEQKNRTKHSPYGSSQHLIGSPFGATPVAIKATYGLVKLTKVGCAIPKINRCRRVGKGALGIGLKGLHCLFKVIHCGFKHSLHIIVQSEKFCRTDSYILIPQFLNPFFPFSHYSCRFQPHVAHIQQPSQMKIDEYLRTFVPSLFEECFAFLSISREYLKFFPNEKHRTDNSRVQETKKESFSRLSGQDERLSRALLNISRAFSYRPFLRASLARSASIRPSIPFFFSPGGTV